MNNTIRTDLLPASLPLFWLAVAAILVTGVWAALHLTFIRQKRGPGFRFLVAFPVAGMAFWLLLQLAARLVFIASPWPLWGLAMLSAIACEATIFIYHHERMLCSPGLRRTILLLRLVAVAAVCFMLVQPVLQREKQRRIRRRVVVLVDDSQSMHRPDTFWTESEQLDMAQAIGELPAAQRPLRLAAATNQVFRTRLAYWAERLAAPESAESITQDAALDDDAGAAARWADGLGQALAALPAPDPMPQSLRADHDRLASFQHLLTNQVAPALKTLASVRTSGDPATDNAPARDVTTDLKAARDALDALQARLPEARLAADILLKASFDEAMRQSISNACATSRIELARRILAGNPEKGVPSLAERLGRRYDLDFYSFASAPLRIADPAAWLATPGGATTTNVTPAVVAARSETDFTCAIEKLIQEIPSEERAGLLMLTDGRHTGAAGVEAVARALGQTQTPVSTILVGGTRTPFDFAIDSVRSRESVFLGDRVRVNAVLTATGANGVKSQVALLRDGETVATQDIAVEGIDWQEEIRLEDMPDVRGTYRYELKIEPDPREALHENNTWPMDIAVSDNRTHVLIADRRPRWEFRYLRNLFYGRDKSIHLQYVLSEPDTIRDLGPKDPVPPASASREFGDAEASALPVSLEEWRKFDVIILGDLDETVLDEQAVKSIQHCVETRGATLVCIAGPRSMPFAIENPAFQAMLPIGPHSRTGGASPPPPEAAFRVAMTTAGRSHEIMSLSTSQMENEALWKAQPLWRWRLPVEEVKPGAEILAVAAPDEPAADETFTLDADAAASPEAAVAAFAELRRQEMRQALVVAQPYGMGKVLMLLTDQTWRLRYQIGDTHHHRFWGQIMRWAAGEQLRAGNAYARMGTDHITYTPDEPVRIRARLADASFTPLANLKPLAILSNEQNDEVARIELTHQAGSSGLYEGTLNQRFDPGSYHVKLDVPGLGGILGEHLPDNLDCVFSVLTARQPKEAAHVTADERVPRALATQSGGKTVSPVEAGVLEAEFGEPSRVVVETLEIPLWCSPWIFAIVLAALTAEWLLRKKGGLT
ncbi:MAG: hypothetical protein ACOX9C_00995 [Kiritimatiellia bacterium]|jgi:hypothetical protein